MGLLSSKYRCEVTIYQYDEQSNRISRFIASISSYLLLALVMRKNATKSIFIAVSQFLHLLLRSYAASDIRDIMKVIVRHITKIPCRFIWFSIIPREIAGILLYFCSRSKILLNLYRYNISLLYPCYRR